MEIVPLVAKKTGKVTAESRLNLGLQLLYECKKCMLLLVCQLVDCFYDGGFKVIFTVKPGHRYVQQLCYPLDRRKIWRVFASFVLVHACARIVWIQPQHHTKLLLSQAIADPRLFQAYGKRAGQRHERRKKRELMPKIFLASLHNVY